MYLQGLGLREYKLFLHNRAHWPLCAYGLLQEGRPQKSNNSAVFFMQTSVQGILWIDEIPILGNVGKTENRYVAPSEFLCLQGFPVFNSMQTCGQSLFYDRHQPGRQARIIIEQCGESILLLMILVPLLYAFSILKQKGEHKHLPATIRERKFEKSTRIEPERVPSGK